MTEPLVVEFEVRATPEHAFTSWTEKCGLWWPSEHTVSQAAVSITFEPRIGGRIFERSQEGVEHVWGEVISWEPPRRVRYWWHMFFDRSEATEVEVTFSPHEEVTTVRIEQSGFERLSDTDAIRRERTEQVWRGMAALYTEHLSLPRP